MIKIGVDTMGGDFAPDNVILGAFEVSKYLSYKELEITLIGDKKE